jgi:hypothetical protein
MQCGLQVGRWSRSLDSVELRPRLVKQIPGLVEFVELLELLELLEFVEFTEIDGDSWR